MLERTSPSTLTSPMHADLGRSRRVNVDFPVWMIRSLDREAKRLGVPRQSLIKVLIAQHLEKAHA